jgi:hypothetical protein
MNVRLPVVDSVSSISAFWPRAFIVRARTPRPQGQRVVLLRNYLHPRKAAERSGALIEQTCAKRRAMPRSVLGAVSKTGGARAIRFGTPDSVRCSIASPAICSRSKILRRTWPRSPRNAVVHRANLANSRLLSLRPSLPYKDGDALTVSRDQLRRYSSVACLFAASTIETVERSRPTRLGGQTMEYHARCRCWRARP